MQRASFFLSALLICLIIASGARARDEIRIVGSSTVFPFVAAAAEAFGRGTEFKTPIVESTGTGGGFKIFCEGVGDNTPDFSNASRPIKASEIALCAEAGVTEITELKIGYDGIVLANAKDSVEYDLTKEQIFLALGREVPKDGKLVENFYEKWNEIDPSLPDVNIAVYGPPPTSGTRDAFVEIVMEQACEHFPEFEVAYTDKKVRAGNCKQLREDGAFIEAGENDNIIVQKLTTNPEAIGLFGFSFLEQNSALVKGNKVGGISPTFENIASGEYGIARSLYVYAKNAHAETIPGLREFAVELTSDDAVGMDGYLIYKGLIPLPGEAHVAVKETAKELKPLSANGS